MYPIIDKFYFNSPIFIQNVMTSIYGRYLYKQRYGGLHSRYLNNLMRSQYFSQEKMYELQLCEMKNLLKHSFQNVPYYRDISIKIGLTADDITTLKDIALLPILEKEDIRKDPIYYCDENAIRNKKYFILNTSGTSGKPLNIYCDNNSRQRHYAFWTRLRLWNGISSEKKRATFFGRVIVNPDGAHPPFWRYDLYGNNYLFSSYHMSEANLMFYYKQLLKIQPEELIGYPSSIFTLAKYLKQNKLKGINPLVIFTTAETLLPHYRELIESQFLCKLIDQYGCTEMAMFVSQCEKGSYHIHSEHGIVEVVDTNGWPVKTGEEGEVICTSFINYTMPLIRYRLGDRAILENNLCECRRNFPVLKEIVGRVDDILVTPDGRPLGRLDPVFKGMKGIYESQIIQTSRDRLEFKMVVDATFTEKNRNELIAEIRKRIGNNMFIQMNIVDNIQKNNNSKFKSVISMINEAS